MTIKILGYGRWCTGKTRQIASIIERVGKDKVFIVSCSDGLQTIAGTYKAEHCFEVRSRDGLRSAWAQLIGGKGDGPLCKTAGAWLLFDGLTEACEWIEDEAIDTLDEVARAVARGERSAVTGKAKEWLRFVNSDGGPDNQKAYGPIGTDCKLLIDYWSVRLPESVAGVYMTAHEQESQRDRQIGPPYTPKLPGKTAREHVMGKMDYVFRMIADNGGTAQMDPAKVNYYWSRTRENRAVSGELPKEWPQFNLAKFVELVGS